MKSASVARYAPAESADMIGCPDNDITAHGSLLIRRAVLRDDWISDTLLDLAAAGRIKWTLAEWETLL
ncbi:MAG: hypothetical protein V3S12_05615, partial [Acidiferrobacterales bacterium]